MCDCKSISVGNNANAHISYIRITWEEWLSEQAKGIGNIARSLSPSLLLIKHYIFNNRALVYVNIWCHITL